MKAKDAPPEFRPGFRFSRFDAIVLIVGVLIAIALAFWNPLPALVVAFVLGHFFLFCNVFRIARLPELIWAGIFFGLACFALFSNAPVRGWTLTFGASAVAAAILIALETRKPSYHGIGWRRFNPGLKDEWNRIRSSAP